MKNAAGDVQCDEYIRRELEDAGLDPIFLYSAQGHSEVPTRYQGELFGWHFRRAWYYWVCWGPAIPFDIADELHKAFGQEVRVAGHCGCPAPREWYHNDYDKGVPDYHVDTQEGLNALVAAIVLADAMRKAGAYDEGES